MVTSASNLVKVNSCEIVSKQLLPELQAISIDIWMQHSLLQIVTSLVLCVYTFSILYFSMCIMSYTGTAWDQQENAKVNKGNNNPPILLFLHVWLRLLYSFMCGLPDFLWMLPPLSVSAGIFLLLWLGCFCLRILWSFQMLLSFPIHGEKCRQINTQDSYLINHNF